MNIIREHALERFWLERRLELLDILSRFEEEVFYIDNEDEVMTQNDKRLEMLKNHYRDVIDPANVADTIKKIYPKHLYGKLDKS